MLPRAVTVSFLAALLAFSLVGCKQLEQRFTPPPKVVTQEATVAVGGAPVARRARCRDTRGPSAVAWGAGRSSPRAPRTRTASRY